MLLLYFLFQLGAAPQNKPELDGIAHVALRVADVAVSREFYAKLDFEQAFEFTDAKGVTTSYVKVNDRQFIELYRRNTPEEPLGLPPNACHARSSAANPGGIACTPGDGLPDQED